MEPKRRNERKTNQEFNKAMEPKRRNERKTNQENTAQGTNQKGA
jgi:hypothetical protein